MKKEQCSRCAQLEAEIKQLRHQIKLLQKRIKQLKRILQKAARLAERAYYILANLLHQAKHRQDQGKLSQTKWAYLQGYITALKVATQQVGFVYAFLKPFKKG
jgi:IS4 transposase